MTHMCQVMVQLTLPVSRFEVTASVKGHDQEELLTSTKKAYTSIRQLQC